MRSISLYVGKWKTYGKGKYEDYTVIIFFPYKLYTWSWKLILYDNFCISRLLLYSGSIKFLFDRPSFKKKVKSRACCQIVMHIQESIISNFCGLRYVETPAYRSKLTQNYRAWWIDFNHHSAISLIYMLIVHCLKQHTVISS